MKNTTTVTFVPQAWINDYAVAIDPMGETKFEVETALLRSIEPDSYDSDELKSHPNIPDWVINHYGPFYFTWEIEE